MTHLAMIATINQAGQLKKPQRVFKFRVEIIFLDQKCFFVLAQFFSTRIPKT